MRRSLSAIVALTTTCALTTVSPAGAESLSAPEVTDIAGDANGVNSQDVGADEMGVQTAPASMDWADITSIRLETAYDTVTVTSGSDVIVRHVPKAVALKIHTVGAAIPPPNTGNGEGIIFRLPFRASPYCSALLEVKATTFTSGTTQWQSRIMRLDPTCPGFESLEGWRPAIMAGNSTTAIFPFAASAGMLYGGQTIFGTTRPHVSLGIFPESVSAGPWPPHPEPSCAVHCATGTIDETKVFPSFTIGSDVPPDVNCTQQPDHPDCP